MHPERLNFPPYLRIVWALGMLAGSPTVLAQSDCSIDIGPDHVICQGESVTINGPAGYDNYLWSNGATTNGITVSNAGNYSVQVSYPTGELVQNGNFNGGNTGFGTQFSYSPQLQNDGNYFIGTNAAAFHPQFVGTGNGNFLMVNSGWWHGGFEAWCQSFPVCPGQWYQLTFRGVSLADTGFPTLQWYVNDQPTWVDHQVGSQNNWQYFTTWWEAPAGVTWADFCIRVTSGNGVGNDFGLDEISISSTITLSDNVNVNVTPLPVFDLGSNATLCSGETLLLDAAIPGASYMWQDGSTNSSYLVTAAGNYNVMVTANGCSASDAINVSYLPRPQVDLGPDETICEGESVLLDVTTPGGTYAWQDGSTLPTYTSTTSGNYSVSVTVNGCTGSDDMNVTVDPLPVIDLGPDRTLCAGVSTTFDATTPNATYLWNDGSTGPTFTTGSAGNVSVEVTVNGCTASNEANVIVNPLPVVNLGPDQTICPGGSVPLSASLPGATYLWSNGSTASSITAFAGDHWVEVTVNGCTTTDQISIDEYVLTDLDLGTPIAFCEGSSVSIGTTEIGSYLWSTGETASSITVDQPGTYWLELTQNGCVISDTIAVTETPLPVVDLGPLQSICPGEQIVLDATTPGATYLWNNGETGPAITVGAGQFSVDVTVNGCLSQASASISEFAVSPVDLGNDTTLCPGGSLLLQATGTGSFLWQDGSSGSTFMVNSAGDYSVQVTDANGCIASDAISVIYADPTAIDLGPDVTICEGEQIVLDASLPGATYLWSTGATTPSITVDQQGSYEVTVTQGNCSVTDQIEVTIAPVPTVFLGNDTTLCLGEVLMLEVDQPGNSILWNDGTTGSANYVVQAGTYFVTVTNPVGCSATDSILVAFASPNAIDLGSDATLCEGEQILLDATLPGATYLWNNGSTTATLTASASGIYWVDVLQGNCSTSDTIQVNVLPVPVIDLGADVSICEGEEVTLNAAFPNATHSWSTGETTASITVEQTGTYFVTSDLNGCTASDQITITVIDVAEVDLGPDPIACSDQLPILDATLAGATYAWSTGETSATIQPASSGNYWVEVTVGNCSATDSILIQVNPSPEVELGEDQSLCVGDELLLNAEFSNASYSWNTGETTSSIIASTTGTYSVTVDLDGCTVSDAIELQFNDPPAIDLGEDVSLCAGEELDLDATSAGDHLWNTGATSASITVSTSGTYWVQVTQGSCQASDTIQVQVNDPGTIELGDDVAICEGESVLLDASLPGATYLWENGSTAAIREITASGNYSVTATVGNCAVSDEIEITVHPIPVIDLGPDVTICPNESVQFNVTTEGADYLWNDGSTGAGLITNTAGVVYVTVSIGDCSASDTVLVTVTDGPIADLGGDAVLCEGSTLQLDVSQPQATYLWDDGSTSPQRMIADEGVYWVNIFRNDCVASDTLNVDLFEPALVDLGIDRQICPGSTLVLESPIPNAQNLWSTGSAASSITITEAGTYWISVELDGCSASDTITVEMVDLPVPDLGADRTICTGEEVELSIEPGAASIEWSTGETTASVFVDEAGSYSVTLELNGCVAVDQIDVNVLEPIITIDLGPSLTICADEEIIIEAELPLPADFTWNNGTIGSSIVIGTPGVYTVEAAGNCVDAIGSIVVLEGDCGPAVHAPNSFTPNGDGINDRFKVIVDGEVKNFRLEIYDRWGELIHSSTDHQEGWDGTTNGSEAQDGVYVWKLFYRNGGNGAANREDRIGHVTLLR